MDAFLCMLNRDNVAITYISISSKSGKGKRSIAAIPDSCASSVQNLERKKIWNKHKEK